MRLLLLITATAARGYVDTTLPVSRSGAVRLRRSGGGRTLLSRSASYRGARAEA